MERFLNVFLGILQNFLKLSRKIILTRSCFWSVCLDQNYHLHCQNLTSYNWNQYHFYYQNQCPFFATTTFSCFSLSLSMTAVFWVWALLCALRLQCLVIYWGNWLQSYHRGIKVPVFSSRFELDKLESHFCISLFNGPNNKLEYWLIASAILSTSSAR